MCAAVFALRVGDVGNFTQDGRPRVSSRFGTKRSTPSGSRCHSAHSWNAREGTCTASDDPSSCPPPPFSPGTDLWPAASESCLMAPAVCTSRGTRGSDSQQQHTFGSGAPPWACNSGPVGGPPSRPGSAHTTKRRGRSWTPFVCRSQLGTQDHRPETLTAASLLPRTYGHVKRGLPLPPGHHAGQPH